MSLSDLIQKFFKGGEIEIKITREKVVEKLMDGKKKLFPALKSSGRDLTRLLLQSRTEKYSCNINKEYSVIVTDDILSNPFVIDDEIAVVASELASGAVTEEEKARSLYLWVNDNLDYDDKKDSLYRNSVEALKARKGVCGSMAFLYIAMARSVGLKADFVKVDIDVNGKKVHHGCAAVSLEGRDILIDPAYHDFDIKHKSYCIISDNAAKEMYRKWRKT